MFDSKILDFGKASALVLLVVGDVTVSEPDWVTRTFASFQNGFLLGCNVSGWAARLQM